MLKNILISTVAASLLTTAAVAQMEVSGEWKVEASNYLKDSTGGLDNSASHHKKGDALKREGTLKLFLNGEVGEESSWHGELNIVRDSEAIDGFDGHRGYSQKDYLRELYVDTTLNEWDVRLGKQQVVWGKADGVKFLDIINPTDFSEWAQNTMEDSRIPLWMAVAEKQVGENGAVQFVWVPDINRINQIAGLENTTTGDNTQPFVSLGADTMTGQVNGFLNIAPEMGKVAFEFAGGQTDPTHSYYANLANAKTDTVKEYTERENTAFNGLKSGGDPLNPADYTVTNSAANLYGASTAGNFTSNNKTNLITNGISMSYDNPDSVFDYMGDTTFATFVDFINLTTEYRISEESRRLKNHNFGVRYKATTDTGMNYSVNYYRHWDNNPMVNMHWENSNGDRLYAITSQNTSASNDPHHPNKVYTTMSLNTSENGVEGDSGSHVVHTDGAANLVFEQAMNRVNTLGGSFDYAIDTSFAPVVIRGEFVYDKGAMVPQVDLGKLAYGDLVGAMTMAEADIFKYVIGADVTVGRNLFTSFQFMDIWNTDHVDTNTANLNGDVYNTFTANPATMSLTNGFKKAEEHTIMYTLFLSKPFLEGEALRVNNLFLLEEEDGGYWNRMDAEYSYSDDIVLTAEWNQYGGDKYGVFGQFEEMSNFQIGAKYIF